MKSLFNGKRHRDTEAALETIIPVLNQSNRNTNSIKSSGSAINQLLESETFDSEPDKKSREP